MTWDTLQWILGVGLFVLFLLVMMRGCGSMGGCGMGRPMERRHRRGEGAEHREMDGSGTAGERRRRED